jgi:hypothetical protein
LEHKSTDMVSVIGQENSLSKIISYRLRSYILIPGVNSDHSLQHSLQIASDTHSLSIIRSTISLLALYSNINLSIFVDRFQSFLTSRPLYSYGVLDTKLSGLHRLSGSL